MEQTVTNTDLSSALALIISRFDALDKKVSSLSHFSTEVKKVEWLNVSELCDYLPSHPREQTVYSWTSSRKIPFHKKGRSIMFDKKEIDAWLEDSDHIKSTEDLDREAYEFVNNKKNINKK